MAISSGRGRFGRLPNMEKAGEFFAVNEQFWYTPLSDKNIRILIEPIPTSMLKVGNDLSPSYICDGCAINKWCGEPGNIDRKGTNYIPSCSDYERVDKTNVFFKEID